ncbi:biotin/lipoate A/B protein ligase family protein [Sphingopyxis sp.]|uniref:lipoate--protein ligase family protein n=1 Tax=Sphingopyxis sp. TaxID=1908224 RepID=UPI0035AF9A94
MFSGLAHALAPGTPVERGDGEAAVTEDERQLNALLAAQRGAEHARLWTNSRCLVTTRRFARMEGFADAAATSRARGWPVFVRTSGGTTVVHRPGILNFSLYEIAPVGAVDINACFQRFTERLIIGFAAIGVSAETGWVKGSYCDGRFNIVSGRKKIAGTACLVRKSGGWFGVLAHAAINIEGDTQADLAAITAFERGLGLDIPYAPASHTNLVARIRMRG